MKFNFTKLIDIKNNGTSSGPLFLFIFALGFFILDRLIKLLYQSFAPNSISINRGLSFSIAAPPGLIAILLTLASIGLLLVCFKLKVYRTFATAIPAALIVGGATSNTYDRLHFGGVLDTFHIWISWFNLADIFIIAGSVLLLVSLTRHPRA